jgi:hypothetical protein
MVDRFRCFFSYDSPQGVVYEYEKYNGGDVFLGDESTTKITGCGKVKLQLKDGRIRTLPGVLHIP